VTIKKGEMDSIDSIDAALEERFSKQSSCCSTTYCYCDVIVLQHRRQQLRMKDEEYMALEE
jgi:hypothetical protein